MTDYLGPVAHPEAKEQVAKELWAALLRRDDWADADLWGLAEDAGWYGAARRRRGGGRA